MRKNSLILLFVFCLFGHAGAELVWDQDYGWQPSPPYSEFADELQEALCLMNLARTSQESGNFGAALSKYRSVTKQFPDSVFAPEAYFQIGKIRLERRQFSAAFKAFGQITEKYPEYPRFNDVLRGQLEIAGMIKRGERPKYFGVIPGFKDSVAAINFYTKIVDEAPFSDFAPFALFSIGEISSKKNKIPEAVAALERLIDEYPYSDYAPEAYLKLGEIYENTIKSPLYDQGATKLAINYYEDFLLLYPNHPKSEAAQASYDALKIKLAKSNLLMGDFYFNARNNRKAAFLMYRKAKESLPNSEVALEAQERIDDLKAGKMPKKTPVDFLFGRYERPEEEQDQIADADASGEDEVLSLDSDLLRINSGDDSGPKKFSKPDEKKQDTSFLELGPQKTF